LSVSPGLSHTAEAAIEDIWGHPPDGTDSVVADDGVRLHVERFGVQGGGSRRVIVFLHGIGAHAGPYRGLATELLAQADAVYLPHLRGHGLSEGERGKIGAPRRVLSDVAAVLRHARTEHPEADIILGGESMGGLFALAYTASSHPSPDRLFLLSPSLRLRGAVSVHPRMWYPLARDTVRDGYPLDTTADGEVARHPSFRAMCRSDSTMMARAPLSYLITIARFMLWWAVKYPSRADVPVLIVQGDGDLLLDPSAAQSLAALLPQADFHSVEGAWHNLLWDSTTAQTTARIASWLDQPDPLRTFCVYRWSWLHRWFRSYDFGFWRGFLVTLAGLSVPIIVAAGSAGVLFAPPDALSPFPLGGGVARISQIVASALSLGLAGSFGWTDSYSSGQPAIPLSRDYLFIAGLLIETCCIGVQQIHWRIISEVPEKLLHSGLIDSGVLNRARVNKAVRVADERINAPSAVARAVVLSALITAAVVFLALSHGIYGLVVPESFVVGVESWQVVALGAWWANPARGSLFTLAGFATVIYLYVYGTFRGNSIGIEAVRMLDELLGTSSRAQRATSGLRIIPEHEDGLGGLEPVWRILGFAIVGTALAFCAYTVLLLFMPREIGVWGVPFLFMFAFVSPYLVSRPVYELNGELTNQRAAAIREANQKIESVRSQRTEDSQTELAYWTWKRSVAEGLPSDVYSLRKLLIVSALYLIPVLTFVIMMVR